MGDRLSTEQRIEEEDALVVPTEPFLSFATNTILLTIPSPQHDMSWDTSRSHSVVIDLTDESPPGPSRSRPSTFGTDTHIRDWSSSLPADRPSSSGTAPDAASSSSSGPSSSRSAAATDILVIGSDDEDDDNSFTITGQSEPVRRSHPLHRSISLASASPFHRSSTLPFVAASTVRFHDGIGRGPHGAGSYLRPVVEPSHFSSDRHPLLPQRRAAVPTAGANAARPSGNSNANGANATANDSQPGFMSRLGGDFFFGRYGFGTTYSMEILGSLIRGWHSNGGADPPQSAESKVPSKYDPKWTHAYDEQPGFTHSIIEPPVDLDTYFDDKAVVTGPLPDTTPICPGCRHALVTGANADERIWVLPCGHVIDGRCLDRLSGLTSPSAAVESRTPSKGKGKAKAREAPEDEPPAKVARTSARNRATATVAEPKAATPTKPKKPKRFECPVQGCCQKCSKESGSKYSAWEVFA